MKTLDLVVVCNSILSLFGFLLTVLFIVVKLLCWVDWSWWWILVPTLLPSITLLLSYKMSSVRTYDD